MPASPDHQVSHSTVIGAPAAAVFAIVADPRQHPVIDGSGSVKKTLSGPDRLVLGSAFGMRMRIGVPYVMRNRVVEYDEDRLIAWRHIAPNRWRYELEPVDDTSTKVTETFDYSYGPPGNTAYLKLFGRLRTNDASITATLARLKSLVENGSAR